MDYVPSGMSVNSPPKWRVNFCSSPEGKCYAEEDILETLRVKDHEVYEDVFDRIGRITNNWEFRDALRSSYFKPVGDGLMELRLSVGAEIRFVGFVSYDAPSPVFYVLCGFRKKSQKLPHKYLKLATRRRQTLDLIRGPTK